MQYINPYDLLNISATNISEIDSARIRKAKAALFLQIDLSFSEASAIGQINYKGVSLTKADCIKVIDELDNSDKKEFNFFIYLNKQLNNFLNTGDVAFFTEYKIESIYSLPEFVDFISPYFSNQYNSVLTKYFKAGNLDLCSKILNVKPLVNKLYHDKCFSGIRLLLNDTIESLKIARDRIYDDNNLSGSDLFDVLFNRIKKIDAKMINLLPYSDFQNSRNSLADSIKSFAIAIHNAELELPDHEKKNFANSLKIIEIAKNIDCEGLEEQKIRENYFIIKKNIESFEERVNLEKANPGLKLFSQLSDKLISKIEEVENKKTTLQDLRLWLSTNVSVDKLNNLDISLVKIKNEIALLLKSLSISVWNKHDNIEVALLCISKALAINTDKQTKDLLISAKNKLDDLKRQIDQQSQTPTKTQITQRNIPVSANNTNDKGGAGIIAGIILLGIIIFVVTNSNRSSNSANSYSSGNSSGQTTVIDSAATVAVDSVTAVVDSSATTAVDSPIAKPEPAYSPPPIPVYNKVTVSNGNLIGCNEILERFDQSLETKIIITAQNTDAAVKLIDYETNKCIRFVFINDGTTYTVRHIPEGKYYLKIAYGSDWSVLEGHTECSGHFTSHASYKKDDNVYDFNKSYNQNGDPEIPYYTLKLYTTYTTENSYNNSSTNSISEDDFNN